MFRQKLWRAERYESALGPPGGADEGWMASQLGEGTKMDRIASYKLCTNNERPEGGGPQARLSSLKREFGPGGEYGAAWRACGKRSMNLW